MRRHSLATAKLDIRQEALVALEEAAFDKWRWEPGQHGP